MKREGLNDDAETRLSGQSVPRFNNNDNDRRLGFTAVADPSARLHLIQQNKSSMGN